MTSKRSDRPADGWTCREVIDANTLESSERIRCEFCNTQIRWIHILVHDDHDGEASSGGCCAARLCFGYNAEAAEREVKNRMARQTRFIDPQRWKRSNVNAANICRQVQFEDGSRVKVTIFLKNDSFGICIANRKGDTPTFHWERYATPLEAKNVAFELVERLKEAQD